MSDSDFLSSIQPILKKRIPFKWRVQSFSKQKPSATCVAYIDARDVMDILDEACIYGWQRTHVQVKENLFCGVGIVMPSGVVAWRYDCGTESQSDAEKGESSDSFKRAAVNWGVGRFLYDMKMIRLPANETYDGKNRPHVVDSNGKQVWDITDHINKTLDYTPEQDPLMSHNIALQKWFNSVAIIKSELSAKNLSAAKEAWNEIPQQDQMAMWVATTKGGIFTTEERKTIKSTEFTNA